MSVLVLPWLIICVCVSYLFWSSVFLTPMTPTLMVQIGIQQMTFSDSAAYSLFLQQVGTLKT